MLTLDRSVPMPARLLAAVAPGFDQFGKLASFEGAVRWTFDQRSVRGSTSGRIEKADLATLLPSGSPHELRGLATIALEELRWNGERLERLTGSIRSDRAQASRSFVDALEKAFHCPRPGVGQASAIESSILELDAIAMRFQLDDRGLTLMGECPATASGCLALSGGRPLVLQPPFRDIPAGVLVQALSAAPTAWIPATREAVKMADRLPLPNATVLR
jgi:hypothetical protein